MEAAENLTFAQRCVSAILRLPGLLFLELIFSNVISAETAFGEQTTILQNFQHHVFNIFLYSIGCCLIISPINSLKMLYTTILCMNCILFGYGMTYAYTLKHELIKQSDHLSILDAATIVQDIYDPFIPAKTGILHEAVTIILIQITLGLLVVYVMGRNWGKHFTVFLSSSLIVPWISTLCFDEFMRPGEKSLKISQAWLAGGVVFAVVLNPKYLFKSIVGFFKHIYDEIRQLPGLITLIWVKYQFSLMFMMYWGLRFSIHLVDIGLYISLAKEEWSFQEAYPTLPSNLSINFYILLYSIGKASSTLLSIVGISCIIRKYINFQFYLLRSWIHWSLRNHPPDAVLLGLGSIVDVLSIIFISVYTGLTEVEVEQRVMILAYIFFTVLSSQFSLFHSLIDEAMMNVLVSPAASWFKHFRVVLALLYMLSFCATSQGLMYYLYINEFQSLWILVISHNYFISFWLGVGSLCIYILTMIDLKANFQIFNVEEISFYIRGGFKSIEYIVNLILCFYLMYTFFYSEISSIPVVILLGLYVYYCIAWKGKKAWNAIKMRRLASSKISTLRNLSADEINDLDDVCPICYQELGTNQVCKEMQCKHLFHESCLLKWFYIKDHCPICHSKYDNKTVNNPVDITSQDIPPIQDESTDSSSNDSSDSTTDTTDHYS